MNKIVCQYLLAVQDRTQIALPIGYRLLHVDFQNETLFVWALVDPNQTQIEYVNFRIAETGDPIDWTEGPQYVGTAKAEGSVYHVFTIGVY